MALLVVDGAAAPSVAASVAFGLLAALGFGGFLVAMDAASECAVQWALLVARLSAVTVFVIAFLVTRPPISGRRAARPVLAASGVLGVGADTRYAVATTEGLLSAVAVLSSLYPVVTIALARLHLRERLGRVQGVSVGAGLCGAAVVAAS